MVLLAGLVFVPALPAVALTSEACPTSIPAAGFTDLTGLTDDTKDAIDCVAHYGIAKGTSATTFSPNNDVLRWQMALFLTRSVSALGVSLPSGVSQGFTDIGSFDAATQTAINQLKQLAITQGTSLTTFTPNGTVPRWQMALFLTRLLTEVGITLPSGSSQGFTDIGSLDAATQTAINQLKQLGITQGTSSTTFTPSGIVPRWQMALFLARSVDAGGGSPYGITITTPAPSAQTSDSVTVTITVKNPDGSLATSKRVDVFVASSIDSNGKCVLDADAHLGGATADGGTGTNCTIDNGDPQTNSSGVATVTFTHTTVTEIDTVYAWTGETNEVFDQQDVRGEASATVTWTAPATALDLPANVVAEYGTSGSIEAQFEDASGNPVALAGQRVRFTVTRGGTTIIIQNVTTATDGSATLTYVGPADPSGGDDPTVVDSITAFWDKDLDNVDDGASEYDDTGALTWDDDLPLDTSATLTQNSVSSLVSTSTTITITVLDKFGQPISGAEITFEAVSGPSDTKTTGGSGTATFTYTGPSSMVTDSIDARVDLDGDGNIEAGDLDFAGVADLDHYWVETAPTLGSAREFDILATNAASNTIDVIDIANGNLWRLTYDSTGDTFTVDGAVKTLDEFEAALAGLSLPDLDGDESTELTTNTYSASAASASTFILETS
jgi:hypothetical protein